MWMESGKGENPGKVLGCEEGLTPKRGVSVVREPGEEYGVDDSLLWEGGSCLTGNTYGAMDVPGCSRVETNGGVQVCFFLYIYVCTCAYYGTNRSDTNAGIVGHENDGETNDTANLYFYFYFHNYNYFHIYGQGAARIRIWHAGRAWMDVCGSVGGLFLYVMLY